MDAYLLKNKFKKTLCKLLFDILNSEDDTIYIDMPNLIKKVKLAQNVKKINFCLLLFTFTIYFLIISSLLCYLVLILIMTFSSFICKL